MEPAWANCGCRCRSRPSSTAATSCQAKSRICCRALAGSRSICKPAARRSVSMEDSTACIHGSRAQREPVGKNALSEPKIVAELAKATLNPNPKLDWDAWVADYSRVRDAIERTYPDQFKDFNQRMFEPGGFPRPAGGARTEMENAQRQSEFYGAQIGIRSAGRDGWCLRADDHARRRSVQHDDL